jgi:hypothetical protein
MGLITESSAVTFDQLGDIANALQVQNTRDVVPIWGRPMEFKAFKSRAEMPFGWIPMLFQDDIGAPGAAGFHTDENGQPEAFVQASGNIPLTASHEANETDVDLHGNRLSAAVLDEELNEWIRYLIELCDPPEAEQYAYQINGIDVSAFLRPEYFDQDFTEGQQYAFPDNLILKPRTLLPGGYNSFVNEQGLWRQRTWFGLKPEISVLGSLSVHTGKGSLREQLDRIANERKLAAAK